MTGELLHRQASCDPLPPLTTTGRSPVRRCVDASADTGFKVSIAAQHQAGADKASQRSIAANKSSSICANRACSSGTWAGDLA